MKHVHDLLQTQVYDSQAHYDPMRTKGLRRDIYLIFRYRPNDRLTFNEIVGEVRRAREARGDERPVNPVSVSSSIRDLRRKGENYPNLNIESGYDENDIFYYKYIPRPVMAKLTIA